MSNFCKSDIDKIEENFPSKYLDLPNWVFWVFKQRGNKKRTKVPRRPRNGSNAVCTEEYKHHRGTFKEACKAALKYDGAGVGFVLTKDLRVVVMDVDAHETDSIERNRVLESAMDHTFGTYSETSPSGGGYHSWMIGTLPNGKGINSRDLNIELYSCNRFITVTGNKRSSASRKLLDGEKFLENAVPALRRSQSQGVEKKSYSDTDGQNLTITGDAIMLIVSQLLRNGQVMKTFTRRPDNQSEGDYALAKDIVRTFELKPDEKTLRVVAAVLHAYRVLHDDHQPEKAFRRSYLNATLNAAFNSIELMSSSNISFR